MRLLFITATRIGDAVLSTGLLAHLLDRHPGIRVTVACGPAAAGLFDAVPGLDRVIVLTKGPFARHWRHFWRQTVGTRWDIVVDLRHSLAARLLLTRRRHAHWRGADDCHRVESLAAVLGLEDQPPAPRIWLADAHRTAAGTRLPDGGPPVLAVAPVANWHAKTWPAERFIALIERLTAPGGPLPGAKVLICGGPAERDAALPVLESLPAERRVDLIGTAPLLEVQACLERCAAFVGNDSGLMHMAAAAGIPTLGLFGPSREEHYGPWGPKAAAIRTPEAYDALFPPDYDYRQAPPMMNSLSVDRVEAAALALLARCRDLPPKDA